MSVRSTPFTTGKCKVHDDIPAVYIEKNLLRQILSAHLIHPQQGLIFPSDSSSLETLSTNAKFSLWPCLEHSDYSPWVPITA